MCGIAGIYAYSASAPSVDRAEVRSIRDHMASRGPDGQGEWFSDDGRLALGQSVENGAADVLHFTVRD